MIEIKKNINCKINIDKRKNKEYNKTNIEIFTIKEYLEYKQKYGTQSTGLSDVKEEYHYINNVHDKTFRKMLENRKNAIRIINNFLKPENQVNIDEIEQYNSSYISDELKNSEADIVYKVKNEEVFFLIEHQTKIDYSMPYRMLKYEISIMDSRLYEIEEKNKKEYPLVKPIVLYTGAKKWDAKLDLREIQPKWNKYEGMELSRYNILDVNELDNEELLKEDNIISKLIIVEKSCTYEDLIENLKEISKELNKKYYTEDEVRACKTTIKAIIQNRFKDEKAKEILKNLKIERGDNMLQVEEMFIREEKRFRAEGRVEGRQEGEISERIKIIKNMLKEKLSINIIASVSGMNEKEIKKIAKDMSLIG